MKTDLVEYLKLLVGVDFTNQCRDWVGPILQNRAVVRYNRHTYSAARLVYEVYRGEIPENYIVRQTCKNLKCVNPKHLVAISRAEVQKHDNLRK